MISAADPNDPAAGRLLVAEATGGPLRDVLPGLEGDVTVFAWQDANTLMFLSDEGEETRFGEVDISTGVQKTHATSGVEQGNGRVPIMTGLAIAGDGKRAVLVGDSPIHPSEVFTMSHGDGGPKRLTDSNPWLADVDLAEQEVFRHQATRRARPQRSLDPAARVPPKGRRRSCSWCMVVPRATAATVG